jgi:hypothetical protein
MKECQMSDIWYLRGSFTSHPVREILPSLLSDDKKNYERAEQQFRDDLKLLDDSLILYLEIIQGAYAVKEKWINKPTFEAPMIMFSTTLNYLLLIRHSLLLGYFREAPTLFRSCHERITRGYLFWLDESEAKYYLSGGRRKQEKIDKKLSVALEPRDSHSKDIFMSLRELYNHESEQCHPNLTSLKMTYGDLEPDKLKNLAIEVPIWGGILSDNLIKPIIFTAIQIILRAISVLKLIYVESSGLHETDFKKIEAQYKLFIQSEKSKISVSNPLAKH